MLNRRQARYILHNVNEVSRILQSRLGREPFQDSLTVTRGVGTAADDTSTRNRISTIYRRFTHTFYTNSFPYIPLVFAVCVVTLPATST